MRNIVLLPKPKSIQYRDGHFPFSTAVLRATSVDSRIESAIAALCRQYNGEAESHCEIIVSHGCGGEESYILDIAPTRLEIYSTSAQGAFYAIQTLRQLLTQKTNLPCMRIEDTPDFAYRGFYHDVSRGRIPTLDSLKELADTLAYYKVNSLQLYVEHTFAFKEYAAVCEGQEVLTAEEIRELDAYCRERFIDLVPSLSTFGHLYALLQNREYQSLCELENYVPETHVWVERMQHHTLDASNPESIRLVHSLIDQYMPLFSSHYFNICCDETFDLCQGRNKGKDKVELYAGFVSQIISYVESQGKTAMLWGDIVLDHLEALPKIPETAVFLNWDYSRNPDPIKVQKIHESGRRQIVCPGTSGWCRLLEYLPESIDNIRRMAVLGKSWGAEGLLNTNWGDYGHTCDPLNAAYGMILGASESWNVGSMEIPSFERALSILHYQNANGNIVRAIHELNDCDSMNVWLQLYRLYEARKQNRDYVFGYTAGELRQKVMRCHQAAMCIAEELNSSNVNKQTGEALLIAARGLYVLLRVLEAMMLGRGEAVLVDELEQWTTDFVVRWRRKNKADELPVLLAYLKEWQRLLHKIPLK